MTLAVALVLWGAAAWTWWFVSDQGFVDLHFARNWTERASLGLHAADPIPSEVNAGLLWPVLLMVVQFGETPSPIEAAAIGAMCSAWTLVGVTVAANQVRGAVAARWAAFVLATSVPFAVWSTGGTGSALATLSVFLCWWFAANAKDRVGLTGVAFAAAAATLSRPDGLLQATVAAAAGGARAQSGTRALGAALTGIAVATTLRTVLFGTPIPWSLHTNLQSIDPWSGFAWLSATLLVCLPIPAAPMLSPWAGSVAKSVRWPISALLAFPVLTGGDSGVVGEAFVGALPFLALLAGAGAAGAPTWARSAGVLATALAMLPHLGIGPTLPWGAEAGQPAATQWRHAINEVVGGRQEAIALRQLGGGRQTVVSRRPGALGYYSRWRVLDETGRMTASPAGDAAQGARRYLAERPTVLAIHRVTDAADADALVDRWREWASADAVLHTTWGPRLLTTEDGVFLALYRWPSPEQAIASWVSPTWPEPRLAPPPPPSP